MPYPALTSPITVGGTILKNRMVMSPLTTYGMADPDGSTNQRHRAYYEARARGGLGLIIVEAASVHISGKCFLNQLSIADDRYIPGLAELVRTIKRHGAAVHLQLHHGGRVASEALSGCRPLAPSPLAPAPGAPVPKEMTTDEIEEIIEAFAQGARRAREAGFDAVELHMGTAYLLLSFVSPAQNLRQDEYGRDFAGRMRFPLRIIDRIRQVAGTDYPIGARIVGSDYYDGGVNVPYCQQIATTLEAAGVAYFDVSGGVGPNATKDSPLAMGYPEGAFADFAAAVKSVVSIPVMSVGRYYSLASAEAVVASGQADLAVFGRALIADPEIVAKSLRGEERKVIPCIGCQACHGGASKALGASCLLNPETGHEYELRIEPAARRRRVLVLGAGVPGLEFARVAARRGHEVTVATAGLPFGGLLTLRSGVPGAGEVGKGVKYFQIELGDLGVRVVEEPPAEPFDVVADARPGSPIRPSVPGLNPSALILGEDILAGRVETAGLGKRIAVIGPGIFAGETALYLAASGKEVTLLATGDRPMRDANPLIAGKTALRFASYGGRTIAGVTLLAAAGPVLALAVPGDKRTAGPFDNVVAAIGWEPPAAPSGADESHAVGDAWDAFAAMLQASAATRVARSV